MVDCDSLGPVWGGCCRAFHHPHSHTKISRRTFWKDLNKSTTAAIRPLAPSHHSPTPTPTLLVQSTAPHALVAAAHKPSGGRKRKSSAFPFHVLVLVFDSPFFCRTGACSSPSSTNFSTPPCCATAVSLLPSSPPSPPPPPPVESYIHQFARPPSRDTRKSQPILPRTPRQQHLYSPSASSPPPHHLILPGRIRLLHPAGPPARPARANRLALTGSLCDSELLARPRPRAASRAIISPCLALLPPLAKPPPDTTSEAGLVAGCLSCCSTTRRCCSSRAHRLTTLGLGERARPLLSETRSIHSSRAASPGRVL